MSDMMSRTDSPGEGSQTPCYLGRLSCGCLVAACVDDPRWQKETARDLARWIKAGMTVERSTCGAATLTGDYCEGKSNCASPKQRAKQADRETPR